MKITVTISGDDNAIVSVSEVDGTQVSEREMSPTQMCEFDIKDGQFMIISEVEKAVEPAPRFVNTMESIEANTTDANPPVVEPDDGVGAEGVAAPEDQQPAADDQAPAPDSGTEEQIGSDPRGPAGDDTYPVPPNDGINSDAIPGDIPAAENAIADEEGKAQGGVSDVTEEGTNTKQQ